MSVNGAGNVTGSGATAAYYRDLQSRRSGGGGEQSQSAAAVEALKDQFTASGVAGGASGVYSPNATGAQRYTQMAEARYASMRGAVESLLGGTQGNGQAFWAMAANNNGFGNFNVDAATQAKAQELTGEDGYFGVRRTTERIMEFAYALAGEGASEKVIENLRDGVQRGFDSVAKMFGGFDKLPELTRDTYDAIMAEFDKWVGKDADPTTED